MVCCFSYPERIFSKTPLPSYLKIMYLYNMLCRLFLSPPDSRGTSTWHCKNSPLLLSTFCFTEIFCCISKCYLIRWFFFPETVSRWRNMATLTMLTSRRFRWVKYSEWLKCQAGKELWNAWRTDDKLFLFNIGRTNHLLRWAYLFMRHSKYSILFGPRFFPSDRSSW